MVINTSKRYYPTAIYVKIGSNISILTQSYSIKLELFSEFDVIYDVTDSSNIDIAISKLSKSMGDI